MFLSDKMTCLLVEQNDMSSSGTSRQVLFVEHEGMSFVEQGDMVSCSTTDLLVEQEDMSAC